MKIVFRYKIRKPQLTRKGQTHVDNKLYPQPMDATKLKSSNAQEDIKLIL